MYRFSYTILNLWQKGDYKNAVSSYLHVDRPVSKAMMEGKEQHELINNFVKDNKRLPKIMGGDNLINPLCEEKQEIPLNDWLKLVFVPDCVDIGTETIYEYKFGTSDNGVMPYLESGQVETYALALAKKGICTTKGEYRYLNLASRELDTAFVWLTDKAISEVEEWLLSQAWEFRKYLEENKINT